MGEKQERPADWEIQGTVRPRTNEEGGIGRIQNVSRKDREGGRKKA